MSDSRLHIRPSGKLHVRSTQIEITHGPSKFDLMSSLFTWKPQHLTVEFQDRSGTYYSVMITAVEAEDGSGDKWLFKGREIIGGKVSQKHVSGFFDTNIRDGHLKIDE